MHKYDLTILVKETMGIEAKIEKLIKTFEGKLGKLTEMGKKQLAYPIKKLSSAHFLSWVLELPPKSVIELDKKLTNDKEVLRHLLIRI